MLVCIVVTRYSSDCNAYSSLGRKMSQKPSGEANVHSAGYNLLAAGDSVGYSYGFPSGTQAVTVTTYRLCPSLISSSLTSLDCCFV